TRALQSEKAAEITALQQEHDAIFRLKRDALLTYAEAPESNKNFLTTAQKLQEEQTKVRGQMRTTIAASEKSIETKDSDYIFLTYILNFMPVGIIGLLLAVIFSAAMSSTAGEINALAST